MKKTTVVFALLITFCIAVWIGSIGGVWMDFLSRMAAGAWVAGLIAFAALMAGLFGAGCMLIGFSEIYKGDSVRASSGMILFVLAAGVIGFGLAGGVFLHDRLYTAFF